MLSIAHVIGIFSPEHGGPVVSCKNYAIGQAGRGHRVTVYALEGYPGCSPAMSLPMPVGRQVGLVDWPPKIGASRCLKNKLAAAAAYDIYHLHGIWLRAMLYGYQAARWNQRPYLVEINGALDPLELATKPLRKKIIRRLFQNRILREAPCIHVNSEREAEHVRELGFRGAACGDPGWI